MEEIGKPNSCAAQRQENTMTQTPRRDCAGRNAARTPFQGTDTGIAGIRAGGRSRADQPTRRQDGRRSGVHDGTAHRHFQYAILALWVAVSLLAPLKGLSQPGTFDSTFQFGPTTPAATEIFALAALPDGKILVNGDFQSIQGYPRNRLARLNSDGSLHTAFDASPGQYNYRILIQPDGKYFLQWGTTICRYHPGGQIDTNFNILPRIDANAGISGLQLGSEGRLLAVGTIRPEGGTNRAVQWFSPNGAWDTNFTTGIQSSVYSAFLQTNGQILVAGDFWVAWPGGGARARVARLNANGTVDTSFDPGTGPNSPVTFVWGQPDGKVVISGAFTVVRDYNRSKIARFNADGTIDASSPGIGGPVVDCVMETNGNLLVSISEYVYRLKPD
jgi:uncharacterized delta-60 repeat protein